MQMRIRIPMLARNVMREIEARSGGQVALIGGFVRDAVIRELIDPELPESKDFDFEVRGASLATLENALREIGRVDIVGAAFGVFKLTLHGGTQFDVSVPRRENKVGIGHQGFLIEPDPNMTLVQAAARRDLTINAMAADSEGFVIDPFNGIADVTSRTLRAVGPQFAEDPLRVLRLMSFASRLNFTVDQATAQMARGLLSEFHTLSAERIFGEFSKWARGTHPAAGFQVLIQTGWLQAFPELAHLAGVEQDAEWHPEGDVLTHTAQTIARAGEIATRENLSGAEREIIVNAAMLHDSGKPLVTETRNGRIISHGHAELSGKLAHRFLSGMRAPDAVVRAVSALAHEHMVHTGAQPTPSVVRRLALRLAKAGTTVRMLALLTEADASGRHPAPPAAPMAEWLRVAESLNVGESRPEPILKGRHLLELGFQPGPIMGPVLKMAFEKQLDGEITDLESAQAWARHAAVLSLQ